MWKPLIESITKSLGTTGIPWNQGIFRRSWNPHDSLFSHSLLSSLLITCGFMLKKPFLYQGIEIFKPL